MSPYTVYVTPPAWDEVQDLPGHMRQPIRRAIAALADEPRPAESKALVRPIQEVARDRSGYRRRLGGSVARASTCVAAYPS